MELKKLKEKLNNLCLHCNFYRIEINDIQIDDFMIGLNMDGNVELDETSTEEYSDPSERELE